LVVSTSDRCGGPRFGDVLFLDGRASVQFGGDRAIWFRVFRVLDGTCTLGWVWLDGFELNPQGDALLRREVFVQLGGLRRVDPLVVRRVGDRARLRRNSRVPGSAVRRVPASR
jgi:hypothetical protein